MTTLNRFWKELVLISNFFAKELDKAVKVLLPYEIEQLAEWLINFTSEKPELKPCLLIINK